MKRIKELLSIIEGKDGPGAKWRRGYEASGHPPGFQHADGKIGPIGGSYREISVWDEPKKTPVHKYRDRADPLSDRANVGLSLKGTPLLQRNKFSRLKDVLRADQGRHGPVNKLPESSPDPLDKFSDAVRDVFQKIVDGKLYISDVTSGPETEAQEHAAEFLEDKYYEIARDEGLNTKTDEDEIYDLIIKDLEKMLAGEKVTEDISVLNGIAALLGLTSAGIGVLIAVLNPEEVNAIAEKVKDALTALRRVFVKTGEEVNAEKVAGLLKTGELRDMLAVVKEMPNFFKARPAAKVREIVMSLRRDMSDLEKDPSNLKVAMRIMKNLQTIKELVELLKKNEKNMLKKPKKVTEGAVKRLYMPLIDAICDEFDLEEDDPLVMKIVAWLVDDEEDDEVDEFLYDELHNQMPYGTQKARTGDPKNWIADYMENTFKDELKPIWDARR